MKEVDAEAEILANKELDEEEDNAEGEVVSDQSDDEGQKQTSHSQKDGEKEEKKTEQKEEGETHDPRRPKNYRREAQAPWKKAPASAKHPEWKGHHGYHPVSLAHKDEDKDEQSESEEEQYEGPARPINYRREAQAPWKKAPAPAQHPEWKGHHGYHPVSLAHKGEEKKKDEQDEEEQQDDPARPINYKRHLQAPWKKAPAPAKHPGWKGHKTYAYAQKNTHTPKNHSRKNDKFLLQFDEENQTVMVTDKEEAPETPAAAAAAPATPAAAAAAPATPVTPTVAGAEATAEKAGPKQKKVKDVPCECKAKVPSAKEKVKIDAKTQKNQEDAEAARVKANVDRKKAEEAIKAASIVKKNSNARATEILKKAKEAASIAARAEADAIRKEKIASIKITAARGSIAKSETVRSTTKAWEATVLHKHQIWKTYKNIKKNNSQATKNLKMVVKSLKRAEKKIASETKQAALHKHNIAIQQRVAEAKRAATVIRQQKVDAESQKIKIL